MAMTLILLVLCAALGCFSVHAKFLRNTLMLAVIAYLFLSLVLTSFLTVNPASQGHFSAQSWNLVAITQELFRLSPEPLKRALLLGPFVFVICREALRAYYYLNDIDPKAVFRMEAGDDVFRETQKMKAKHKPSSR